MWNLLNLLLIVFITFSSCEKFRYDNYTLYKILPKNVEQTKLLQKLQFSDNSYDFWNDAVPSATFVNIMSDPDQKAALEHFLNTNGVEFDISLTNVQE